MASNLVGLLYGVIGIFFLILIIIIMGPMDMGDILILMVVGSMLFYLTLILVKYRARRVGLV